MANEISITVGTGTITVPFKGTSAQIRAAMRRFAESQGLDTTGMADAQIGEAALRWFLRTVKGASMAQQRTAAYADLAASLESDIAAANDIYDEP